MAIKSTDYKKPAKKAKKDPRREKIKALIAAINKMHAPPAAPKKKTKKG